MAIFVIGSFMVDCVTTTPRLPKDGETIIGTDYNTYLGGKGANQAVAARRLGSNVGMAGMLGEDDFGTMFLEQLTKEDIDTTHILRSKKPTGRGMITLDHDGQNRIVIIPGANMAYPVNALSALRESIEQSQIVLMQLELPIEVIEQAASMVSKAGRTLILNPAPARELSDTLLSHVSILTPNETELANLSGMTLITEDDVIKASRVLIDRGVKMVVTTLGDKGALYVDQHESFHVSGFPVSSIDTVAAGDAFNGALSHAIEHGQTMKEALRFANAVGALCVQKNGAIPSLPYRDSVLSFLNDKTDLSKRPQTLKNTVVLATKKG